MPLAELISLMSAEATGIINLVARQTFTLNQS